MSFDVTLRKNGKIVEVPKHEEGGTFVLGGCREALLNVTGNYVRHFNFRSLDGERAGSTIGFLEEEVDRLGTVRHPSYWEPTEGNAGHAVNVLLGWARLHPDAVWEVED